ncbi:hypothetical protein WA026_010543 [Henosepilachna vigintioctopunctata]|uniref:5'-nucleotidase domain-containing protein 1 n=1 Tax=Henosepilachna vigintioctopunctata TaxID=420089 RepID=A0AAW1V461_9CUCU
MTDILVQDPLKTLRAPNSDKIRSLLDYYESIVALIFARLVDTKDEEADEPISKYTVYADIYEGLVEMFTKDTTQSSKGGYYKAITAQPDKYYFKCSKKVINLLKNLKMQGKLVYLLTGSYIESASSTAAYCLGPNWKDYFDIIIGNAKKPAFFYANKEFKCLDGFKATEPISAQQLELNGVYVNGNWKDLREFIVRHLRNPNPKCLYVGDHLLQDIYGPSFFLCCDTVAICEELAGKKHPYEKTINSSFWGSYFNDEQVDTFWFKLMKDHSKMWFSDMDALADIKCDSSQ